ncbi:MULTISPECIES: DUF421 domain-containing protein [unclassified Coleofasciculus]|uniref:DUF421 domain-containing protein n=1 Tax=unclassified Coleofasciculus TaxID=2692782 RepID=UPI00187F7BA9|nr:MULTISPECIES: YetF domain-containing protein [unclassified Coleofasciculus]MBE9129829.1 DUF421 domain-containing protein [Coleofasciculus sp. LEGE 07081]MBE9151962.1 DUF421 domain-containing protein [Coleofasciculus sp. LEGE 07092]
MVQSLGNTISWLLGLEAQTLSFCQMGLRAALIYAAALVMVRVVGDRRFIGKYAAMDVLLGVILGSTLSRAINGGAPYFKTLGAALALVGMHWLFCAIAFYYERFDTWIKGNSRILIRDGQINKGMMKKSHISQSDLESSLRLNAKVTEPNQVEIARLESNGEISVMPKPTPPRVLEVNVKAGVQTVRIELN